jgi:hypothetical protein
MLASEEALYSSELPRKRKFAEKIVGHFLSYSLYEQK